MHSPAIRTARQGKFELRNVRSGSYELYAVFQDRSVSPAKYFVAHTTIDVGVQDLTGIALTITPGIDLSGTVKVSGRNPATPIRVQLRPRVALPNWTGLAVVSTDGNFAIPNVPEAQYRISIESSDPNSYVAELFQGRNSIVDRGIVSVVRGLPDTIEAVIQSPAAAIRGTVLASEEQLAAGVVITLVPEEDRRENFALFKRAIVGVDGAFSFGGVSPGRYKLFAWDRIPDGAEQNAEFMDAYNDKGTEIVATIGRYFIGRAASKFKMKQPLQPMPAKPTLVDFFNLRFDEAQHTLQSATRALKNGASGRYRLCMPSARYRDGDSEGGPWLRRRSPLRSLCR